MSATGRAVVVLLAILAIAPATAHAGGFSWSEPVVVSQPPFNEPLNPTAIACPSLQLCIIVDGFGNMLRSQDPAAAHPTWTQQTLDTENAQVCAAKHCPLPLLALDCPTTSFCAAVDN